MKNQLNTVKGNIAGAIAGGVILYFGAKHFKVGNKYALIALAVVGIVAGAHAQSAAMAHMGAKKSAEAAKK